MKSCDARSRIYADSRGDQQEMNNVQIVVINCRDKWLSESLILYVMQQYMSLRTVYSSSTLSYLSSKPVLLYVDGTPTRVCASSIIHNTVAINNTLNTEVKHMGMAVRGRCDPFVECV
ncbi:hypothetical protein Avbf_16431 [Armadillidium vulgare]|nr:hypothetical protein Avbf_16431 [Armadillidium vulgare]